MEKGTGVTSKEYPMPPQIEPILDLWWGEEDADWPPIPHVLVVDDDQRLRELLSKYLSENGVIVAVASGAQEAKSIMERLVFDLVILDVMMPGESGFEVASWMREGAISSPLLFLSAKGEVSDRLEGFNRGGDDYLPKPFDPAELVARMNALLRRGQEQKTPKAPSKKNADLIQFGSHSFNTKTLILSKSNKEVLLTHVERHILKELLMAPHEPLSRDSLAEKVSEGASARSIDVQIVRLRRKIEENRKHPRYLQTSRNKGYMFIPD